MKRNDYQGLDMSQLRAKAVDLQRELFNLRFQLHTGRLEDTSRIRKLRKEIARIKTVERQNMSREVR